MSKRFLRHFFDFNDPFFFPSSFYRPMRIQFKHLRPIEREAIEQRNQPRSGHDVFENFFNENQITEEEKDFFKKHYPEKVQEKFDPFKVLEIEKNATEDQIKEAYRKLALKYHPKNNSSP
jgi:DnaJ-domain-containing protein 1